MSEITNQLIYMPSSDWLLRTNWAKRRIQIRIVAPWQLSVVDCNNQQQKKKKRSRTESGLDGLLRDCAAVGALSWLVQGRKKYRWRF